MMDNDVSYSILKVCGIDFGEKALAVIWVHACWSGQSLLLRRKIVEAAGSFCNNSIELIELDHDSLDTEWYKQVFCVHFPPQGKGDVLWIRNGSVVNADTNCYLEPIEFFRKRFQELTNSV